MDNNLELIRDYLERHFDHPPENLTPDSRLDEIGIDSMALLELIFELEDKYDIRLPDDVSSPETVGQLLALVEQYKPSAVHE